MDHGGRNSWEDEGSKVNATPYTTMFIALLTLTSLLTTTGVRVNRKRDIILFHEIIDTKQHPRLKSVRLTNNCSYHHERFHERSVSRNRSQ